MKNLDVTQGVAKDVGEFWAKDAECGKETVIHMSLDDNSEAVDFAFNNMNLVVPVTRLRRLLEVE